MRPLTHSILDGREPATPRQELGVVAMAVVSLIDYLIASGAVDADWSDFAQVRRLAALADAEAAIGADERGRPGETNALPKAEPPPPVPWDVRTGRMGPPTEPELTQTQRREREQAAHQARIEAAHQARLAEEG